MPTFEKGDVRLYYEQAGALDGPVLVLVNSLGSSLRMWDKALSSLEKTTGILRYDTRGHGKSNVPSSPYAIEQLGNDLLFLLDYLAIDRVDVCGISLGGLISMWLGIHAPQRLRRMVLASTASRIGTREGWEQRIAMVQSSGMDMLAIQTLERWFTPAYRGQHADEMETIRQMISTTNVAAYCGCCSALRDTDLTGEIAAIDVPCLVISGTHDPVTTPSDGWALHSALPNSRYVELDASHLTAWERAEEFAVATLAFLKTEERSDG
jgi:3-oxoadipate enol-lactonase